MNNEPNNIFERVTEFPNAHAASRFADLVGLDSVKQQLVTHARVLLDPSSLNAWSQHHYRKQISVLSTIRNRPPLFILAGDVGNGKTALAETFGDAVARSGQMRIVQYSLSLKTRGTGIVGEMSNLISTAFTEVHKRALDVSSQRSHGRLGVVLLIDEADALAQSRASAQMHHEDRAGVNALIRGIDHLSNETLPALIVMCTNRLDAIDPAIRRRAAATFVLSRPATEQRAALLTGVLDEIGFTPEQIAVLVERTGPTKRCAYGYTYSDLTQRILPAMVMAAYPDKPIQYGIAERVLDEHPPTPPFQDEVTR